MSYSLKLLPIHILLVEDNADDRELITRALRSTDRRVVVHAVESAEAALAYLFRADPYYDAPAPAMIILDWRLPGAITSDEFLERIKSDPDYRHIPVLVLTASDHPEDVRFAYHWNASCYIIKPKAFQELEALMARATYFWTSIASLPR